MYTIDRSNEIKALIDALKTREEEVFGYQFNIDNFKLALEEIEGDPEMVKFGEQLRERLQSELDQQKIAQTMLTVVTKRLDGEDIEELLCGTQN